MWVALVHTYGCPFKKRRSGCTQRHQGCLKRGRRPHENTGQGSRLQAKERNVRRNQTFGHLHLGCLASQSVKSDYLLFQPLRYSATAALANKYTHHGDSAVVIILLYLLILCLSILFFFFLMNFKMSCRSLAHFEE